MALTERPTGRPGIVLRNGRPRDLVRMMQLLTDPVLRAHLGGPRPKAIAWPMAVASIALARCSRGRWAQVVADQVTGQMLGTVMVDRRLPQRPGHILAEGRELELSYVLLPDAWGRGAAEAACRHLLAIVAIELPDQPVLVVTQSTNHKAQALASRLGFQHCGEFTEFGSPQIMLAARLHTFVS